MRLDELKAGLARQWDAFVGPGQSTVERCGTAAAATAGAVIGSFLPGAGAAGRIAMSIAAMDLWGGAWVNNTPSCVRWYERPGQDVEAHVKFAALHVIHVGTIAAIDVTTGKRAAWSAGRWASIHLLWMLTSTAGITSAPKRARLPLAVVATAVGLGLDRRLGASAGAWWFAPIFYTKLLVGHAAGSIWNIRRVCEPGE